MGSRAISRPRGEAQRDGGPVAGRISPGPDALEQLVLAWHASLVARGKRRKGADAYRASVQQASRIAGWADPSDITAAAIDDYLVARRSSGEWSGATANRNLSAFRSFARYLAQRGLLGYDALAGVERHEDDGRQGMRAATAGEARRHLEIAAARERSSRYKPSNRALQVLMMYQAGLRAGEPGLLEWGRHVHLDGPRPMLVWTRDVQKNRRDQEVAIHPELAELLRAHRDAMRALSASVPEVLVRNARRHNQGPVRVRPVSPDAPGSFVFPWVSSCFEADARRAGVPKTDARGRGYAPHSARKYFETALVAAGVHQRMVDFLMRHRGGVAMRYYDPPLADQAAAVALLPNLAPEVMHSINIRGGGGLTSGPGPGKLPLDEDASQHFKPSVGPADVDARASSSVLRGGFSGPTDRLQPGGGPGGGAEDGPCVSDRVMPMGTTRKRRGSGIRS